MEEIDAASAKIAEIISTVDEIAFQTNLLAVNAAIEAARAGEEGRGFAVVATEVRALAGRSAEAAKQIKGLIQDSLRKVERGTGLVLQSGETLKSIVGAAKRVTDIVGEMAAASAEQTIGVEQVNRAVAQMDQVTQSGAAQTEELSSTAQGMADQAHRLQELVGAFTLGGAAREAGPRRAPAGKQPLDRSASAFAGKAGSGAAAISVAAVSKTQSSSTAPRARAGSTALATGSEESFQEF
jgi:hypothetical protein